MLRCVCARTLLRGLAGCIHAKQARSNGETRRLAPTKGAPWRQELSYKLAVVHSTRHDVSAHLKGLHSVQPARRYLCKVLLVACRAAQHS